MPAPRAVLADITEHGLDPNVAHSNLNKLGKLVPQHKATEEKVEQPKPVFASMHEHSKQKKKEAEQELIVEPLAVEEVAVDEQIATKDSNVTVQELAQEVKEEKVIKQAKKKKLS